MSKNREKELLLLIYEQNQIIKASKKQIKIYRDELNQINGNKKVKNGKKRV